MTDIVHRLRERARAIAIASKSKEVKYQSQTELLCLDAADEIDWLRKVMSFAAGYISANPIHAGKYPEEIVTWLEKSASGDQ